MQKRNLLIFALILFLTLNVFAAAPTLSAMTVSPIYATDHNYSDWSSEYMTISTTLTGADLNLKSCYYGLDGSFIKSAIDINGDTNTFTTSINVPGATDDVNWCIKCANNSAEENQTCRILYLDSNAPTTTIATSNYTKTITITGTDEATNTGNGSGIKRIYYKVDSAAWASSINNPFTYTLTSNMDHTVLYYATDNLDNNEGVTTINSTTFYSGPIDSDTTVLLKLIGLILCATMIVVLIGFIGAKSDNPWAAMLSLVFSVLLAIIVIFAIML